MRAGIALALQLQTSRVFWLLDLLAAIYIAWLLAETKLTSSRFGISQTIVAIVCAVAIARGLYVWRVEHAGDPIVRIGLARDNWTDAMSWISRRPADTHVLADPGHAWKYGTSVRVSAERDVFVEEVKDLALALYSRDVAIEALRRVAAVSNFDALTPDQLRTLAGRYDLDYLIAERDIDLPILYRNEQFRVSRCNQAAPRHERIRSGAPLEGGPLDDLVRVGQASSVSHASDSSGQVLRCRRRDARACPLPLAAATVGASNAHRPSRSRKLERRALRPRPRGEGLRRRLQCCQAEPAQLRRDRTLSDSLYHSGLTDDPLAIIRELIDVDGLRSIGVAGYSLGGNLALKLAGDLGSDAPEALRAVCAVSPTMDLAVCVDALEKRQNAFYQWHFVRNLKARMRRKAAAFPESGRSTRCHVSHPSAPSTKPTLRRTTAFAMLPTTITARAPCVSSIGSACRR